MIAGRAMSNPLDAGMARSDLLRVIAISVAAAASAAPLAPAKAASDGTIAPLS